MRFHRWILRTLVLVAFLGPGCSARAGAELDSSEEELRAAIFARADPMRETLRSWVGINTGSWNGVGLERFARMLGDELRELGFQVVVNPGVPLELPGREGATTGPMVVAQTAGPAHPRFLLIGHIDTVFEPDSSFQTFGLDPDDPEKARGPGTVDMKGGLVILLETLRALRSRGDLSRAAFTVLLNSDEEIGSLGSRAVIEEQARTADYGFVFESARSSGAMVRSRRGLGQFHLSVRGVAAHAGSAHEKGRSAVLELAGKIVRIEALTDYEGGVTVNVGTLEGGTKRNIVPAQASAWIDVRYDRLELGSELRSRIEEIARTRIVEGTTTRVWGRLHRPPKVETDGTRRLLSLHAEVAEDLGLELPPPVHAGGGTDGSLTAAQGLATLDSMGPVGGGAHTEREFVLLPSLAERAALAAVLLHRLIERPVSSAR
ncbi:MAG: M20 family metallopeptidase [Myxococcota bacterium]